MKAKSLTGLSIVLALALAVGLIVATSLPLGLAVGLARAAQHQDTGVGWVEVTSPETWQSVAVETAIAEITAAAQESDLIALNETGITTNVSGKGYWAAKKARGSVDTSGNAFLREPKVLGGPFYHSSYWIAEAGIALFKIDFKVKSSAEALKILGKPKAKWVADPTLSQEAGARWRSTLLPGHGWELYSDPYYLSNAERSRSGSGTLYRFSHTSPYFDEVKAVVEVDLDGTGRVTSIREASRQAAVTYDYVYSYSPFAIPSRDLHVDEREFELAVETTAIPRLLANIRRTVVLDLSWDASKATIVDSLSEIVPLYNESGVLTFEWKEEARGARVWVTNPVNGKTSGLVFAVSKSGKVKVRKF